MTSLRLRAKVNFPANVIGGTAISVGKANGKYTIDTDYSELVPITAIPPSDVPNLYTLLWNSATGVYELAPITLVGQVYTLGNTVQVAATPYAAQQNDGVLIVTLTGVPKVINLPLAAQHNGPIHISDGALDAGNFNITINPSGSEKILGQSSWRIAAAGAGVTLYPIAGTGWFL